MTTGTVPGLKYETGAGGVVRLIITGQLNAEKAGADGVAITALMGFLIGLILAFQSSMAMAKFSAQIYTADLVVIASFRELGPLITCFMLASRSGSAFAAELGTMKINEEIDALKTMGIDPVQFLGAAAHHRRDLCGAAADDVQPPAGPGRLLRRDGLDWFRARDRDSSDLPGG